MQLDTSNWSGDGAFTETLIETLKGLQEIIFVRVEDVPSSRAETGYNFISNELYLAFKEQQRVEAVRRFGLLPGRRTVVEKTLTIDQLASRLGQLESIGAPDYSDAGMIQYLRTERIIPPYQTRGIKVVELVRIYEVGTAPRRDQ